MMTTNKGAELLARARELAPVFRDRAAAAEKARCVPPVTIADLRAAGLLRTLQPAVLGGFPSANSTPTQLPVGKP